MRRRRRRGEIDAVHPNAGTRALYQKRLDMLIRDMHRSVLRWVRRVYRDNEPKMAMDTTAAEDLAQAMRDLSRIWLRRFDRGAEELAAWFSADSAQRTDYALRMALQRAGFTVRFRMTPAARDIIDATVQANVALIKSIPQQYLTQVEGMVMRSVQTGRDIGGLTREIEEQFGVSRRRAALIATDQNAKATSAIQKARQVELGLTKGIWIHSGGGKTPRPKHVAVDGQEFDLKKGMRVGDKGNWVMPGEEINCFPADVSVTLESLPLRLWRSFFDGPMIYVDIGTDLLKGTPNHPVLTANGWRGLGSLEEGDQVVCMLEKRRNVVRYDEDKRKTTFGELFKAMSRRGVNVRRNGVRFNFYGDRPDGDVDEIIVGDDNLLLDGEACSFQEDKEFAFSESNRLVGAPSRRRLNDILSVGGSSFFGCGLSDIRRSKQIAGSVGCAATSDFYTARNQHVSNVRSCVLWNAESGRNSGSPHAGGVKFDDTVSMISPPLSVIGFNPDSTELFAEFVRVAANDGRGIIEFGSGLYEFCRVRNKRVRDFSGHVFTMETRTGYYSVGDASIQAKNCRCVWRALVPGF